MLNIDLIPDDDKRNIELITSTIESMGHTIYLVGGSVRDLLMNKIPIDYDFTTSAHPTCIKNSFPRVIDNGILYGTLTIVLNKKHYEITTFRIDKDYIDGRRPDIVEYGHTLEEDLKRRDFTMNAIGFNWHTRVLVDPYNGIQDIRSKLIRTVGDPIQRFLEDGLRPIRAMRFASVLGFTLDPSIIIAIPKTQHVIKKISIERFVNEIFKSYQSKKPSIFTTLLFNENIIDLFIPDINKNNDNRETKILLLDNCPRECDAFFMYCWLTFFYNLDKLDIKNISSKLKLSKKIIKTMSLYADILHPEIDESDFDYCIRKNILRPIAIVHQPTDIRYKIVENCLYYWQIMDIGLYYPVKKIYKETYPLVLSDLACNANDILHTYTQFPHKKIGHVLAFLLDIIIKNPHLNEKTFLLNQVVIYQTHQVKDIYR